MKTPTSTDPLGTAFAVIMDGIRALPEYRQAEAEIREAAFDTVRRALGPCRDGAEGVRIMRSLGGFSAVVARAVEGHLAAHPELAVKECGSTLIPMTVADAVRRLAAGAGGEAIREELQRRTATIMATRSVEAAR
jgi:hypothetical protein